MPHLDVIHLAKSFGENELLQDISFQVADGERVGLVGANGCGKTTLLRILARLEQADSGTVRLSGHAAVGLFSQVPDPAADLRAIGLEGLNADWAYHLNQIGLDINLPDRSEILSGGERAKLALGRFLAERPDLMLLDEPTNNLDLPGIQAAVRLFRAAASSLIIVSHDRYFLDSLVTRILEIEDGRIAEYAGNYTFYRQEKERLFQEQLHRYEEDRKQQRQIQEAIRQTRQWAEKAHRNSTKKDSSGLTMGVKEKKRAKAMKMDKKAKSDIKRLERLVTVSENKPRAEAAVVFEIAGQARHGRRILEARDLSKHFGEARLFAASSFHIARQEKVALFGPNGCGKSTLIRMIQGLEPTSDGQLWLSPGCRPFVLSQIPEALPAGQTLLDYLTDKLGRLDAQDRASLAQMGLTLRHLQQTAGSFSLGEQMKIKLAEMILAGRDFLILDEPTNYLDLHTRERLEQALADYQGTLLVVSHDAYLLQRLCNKVLVFEDRRIRRLESSFAEYLEQMKECQ